MTREKDTNTTQDGGDFTQSGTHAAGAPANDTTQVNREPNLDPASTRQRDPAETAETSGGTDLEKEKRK